MTSPRPTFQLTASPITIGAGAWIAAEAFVGPGVEVGEGAVLGARGVAFRSLEAWTVYGGNPAKAIKPRVLRAASADDVFFAAPGISCGFQAFMQQWIHRALIDHIPSLGAMHAR